MLTPQRIVIVAMFALLGPFAASAEVTREPMTSEFDDGVVGKRQERQERFALGAEVVFREVGFGPGVTATTAWYEAVFRLRPRVAFSYLTSRDEPRFGIAASEFGVEVSHSSLEWRNLSLAGFLSVMPELWLSSADPRFVFHGNAGIMAIFDLHPVNLIISLGVDQSSVGMRVWF